MEKIRIRKTCFVPNCGSNNRNSPGKLFVRLPVGVNLRKKWAEAVGRKGIQTVFSPSSSVYCCEDHFNISEDILNYGYVKSMGGRIKLKKGILPRVHGRLEDKDFEPRKRTITPGMEYTETAKLEPLIDVPRYSTTHDVDDPLESLSSFARVECFETINLESSIDIPFYHDVHDESDPLEDSPSIYQGKSCDSMRLEPLIDIPSYSDTNDADDPLGGLPSTLKLEYPEIVELEPS